MRRLVCGACGLAYENATGLCPRCERIDSALPSKLDTDRGAPDVVAALDDAIREAARYEAPPQLDTPPPVVIPGPPSPMMNTLAETRGLLPSDLDRFAATPDRPPMRAPEGPAPMPPVQSPPAAPPYVPEDVECPQCAERIKVRAKLCRFCGYDLTPEGAKARTEAARKRSSGRLRAIPDEHPRSERERLVRRRGRFWSDPMRPKGYTFLALSIVCAVIACFFFPIIFGPASIVLGAISCVIEGPIGIVGVMGGIGGMLVGFVLGFAVALSRM